MEVVVCPNPEQVGRVAAARVAQVLHAAGPECVLGVATGSSPLALYNELAILVERGELNLEQASAFALDEYVGLPEGHPLSYRKVIDETVTVPLKMQQERVHVPNGFAEDIAAAAEEYELAIAQSGGVDAQILGVGTNGHIGFNEPTSSLASRTRIKTLTARTRNDNARFFNSLDEVPTHCLTQGLGTILAARNIVLVAQGEHKAEAIAGLVEGPVTAVCPGSVLQLHEHVTIVIDEAAASGLHYLDYYRDTYAQKPEWQRFESEL